PVPSTSVFYALSLHDALPICGDLLHVPATRLRLHSSRRLPPGFAGDFLHGSRGPFRERRPDASRTFRHRVSALFAKRHRDGAEGDRKSTRLNSSHVSISYAVF